MEAAEKRKALPDKVFLLFFYYKKDKIFHFLLLETVMVISFGYFLHIRGETIIHF